MSGSREETSADRAAVIGACGLRFLAYTGQDAGDVSAARAHRRPVAGLRVHVPGHPERPIYHSSTGIYGFLKLPPTGPGQTHTVHIEDPKRRYLPRQWRINVSDQRDYRRALERDDLSGWDLPGGPGDKQSPMARDMVEDVLLYAAADLAIPAAEMVVWGLVTDKNHAPVPYAKVVITEKAPGSDPVAPVVAATDADGVYVGWIARRDIRRLDWLDNGSEPAHLACRIEVYAPAAPLPTRLAHDFNKQFPPQASADLVKDSGVELKPGVRERIDLQLSNWALPNTNP